jgi:predicted ATPase/class 3 adenylate cyclase
LKWALRHDTYDDEVTGGSTRAFLFSDIEGSTALLQRAGASYEQVIGRHREIVRQAMMACAGVEHGTEGDSFFLTFGSAAAAVRAAVAVQLAHQEEVWPDGERVRARIGLHIGDVSDTPGGLFGVAIHRAARIMATAHGGQIIVSDEVRLLAGDGNDDFSFRELGTYRLRDIGAVRLFQVTHAQLDDEFPALRAQSECRTNLPRELTSLIGRDQECLDVSRALTAGRLVTLIGAGGVGKTRLAKLVGSRVDHRFPDGVWFVGLDVLTEQQDVMDAVARALGMRNTRELMGAIADKKMLIILDNCEHVIGAAADAVHTILSDTSDVAVLATSREPLAIVGEVLFRVPSLSVPPERAPFNSVLQYDACRLFWERALLGRPSREWNEEAAEAICEICRPLDGLPLAIELAAARAATFGLSEIARLLEDRFRFLTSGPRSPIAHQRTLRATVDWSYELLSANEQELLAALSVFRGGFDLESAAGVTGTSTLDKYVIVELISSLHDKSLIVTDDRLPDRFRLPETIRQYASEKLGDALVLAQRQHAHWFADRLNSAGFATGLESLSEFLQLCDVEFQNLVSAVETMSDSEPETALRTLNWMLRARMLILDDDSLLPQLLRLVARTGEISAGETAFALMVLSFDAMAGLVDDDYTTRAAESKALLDKNPELRERGEVEALLEYERFRDSGEFDEHHTSEIIGALDRSGVLVNRLWGRDLLAKIATDGYGLRLFIEAEQISDRYHEVELGQYFRLAAAVMLGLQGMSDSALASARRGLAGLPSLVGSGRIDIETLALVALLEGEHGDLRRAISLAEDMAITVQSRPHNRLELGSVVAVLARLSLLEGDLGKAEEQALRANDLSGQDQSFHLLDRIVRTTLAAIPRLRGDPNEAARRLAQIATTAHAAGRASGFLEEAARTALALGRPADAADLLATASAIRSVRNRPVVPIERADVESLAIALIPLHGRVLDNEAAVRTIVSLSGTELTRESLTVPG